jgi:phthalate 4,5-cis-dihydrodiol dehydrogenase
MEIRLGIVGMGAAARALVPAVAKHPGMRVVAVCDPVDEVREAAARRLDARAVASIDELLALADVDAVYIATPTDLHAAHVVASAAAGKHVLVEKPMATTLDEATRMIDACERAGVVLTVGHSHSFDEPYRAMRDVIASGTLGRAHLLHNIYYSDWVYRPRRPEELDERLGGGITFRQGAHQFDILRLLGGGLVRSVRAHTFDWDPQRPVIGAHTVMLTFADGAVATAIYNGYGAFPSSEITYGIGEIGYPSDARPGAALRRPMKPRANDRARARRRPSRSLLRNRSSAGRWSVASAAISANPRPASTCTPLPAARRFRCVSIATHASRSSTSSPTRSPARAHRCTTGAGAARIWKFAWRRSNRRARAARSSSALRWPSRTVRRARRFCARSLRDTSRIF